MQECTLKEYIQNSGDLLSRINAIDALIDAMILNMADVVDTTGTISYRMDDGQMNVNTEYRSVSDVSKGINSLEKMKQMYINRYNGRLVVFRGRSKF